MCRIAAYLGPTLRVSTILREAKHSLEHQSRAAREMSETDTAGDGWGIGWYLDRDGRPGMLKSILPLWSDENAKTATHALTSESIVGHIRLASPNVEVCFTNTPLYALDEYLFTMNGELQPWPGVLSRALRAQLHDQDEANIRGSTDAEMLAALWRTCLRRTDPQDLAGALRAALSQARKLVLEHKGSIKTNIIVASHSRIAAVRYAEDGEQNTLYYNSGQSRWEGGTVIASEPLDGSRGWRKVPPSTLIEVDQNGVQTHKLTFA